MCVASPMVAWLSAAVMLKVSFLPSTDVSVAVAVMVSPSAEGLMCVVSILAPTVVSPSSKDGATASMAAFSISATIAGVANTSKLPDPNVLAVFVSSTFVVTVWVNPFSILMFRCLVGLLFPGVSVFLPQVVSAKRGRDCRLFPINRSANVGI